MFLLIHVYFKSISLFFFVYFFFFLCELTLRRQTLTDTTVRTWLAISALVRETLNVLIHPCLFNFTSLFFCGVFLCDLALRCETTNGQDREGLACLKRPEREKALNVFQRTVPFV